MAFEDNELLFGADKTPRIVAIELGETGTVRVYRREKDGSTTMDVEPFHPFVWTDGDITDLGLENAQKLAGDLRYNWLVVVDSWKELIALRNGLKKAGRNFFALSDPVQHYLSATGRTLFKQLPFEGLSGSNWKCFRQLGKATWLMHRKTPSPASPCLITAVGNN